jgi:hypothetical protein
MTKIVKEKSYEPTEKHQSYQSFMMQFLFYDQTRRGQDEDIALNWTEMSGQQLVLRHRLCHLSILLAASGKNPKLEKSRRKNMSESRVRGLIFAT